MDRANIVIIGGGVVGCAVARALSRRWSDVFLVEQMPKLGMGASTRNSGVIHSGIYYKPGSFKAKFARAGSPPKRPQGWLRNRSPFCGRSFARWTSSAKEWMAFSVSRIAPAIAASGASSGARSQ